MTRLILIAGALAGLAACAAVPAGPGSALPAMVVVDERDVTVDQPPPHGAIGMSTAFRMSDAVPQRNFEFRKRALHVGAAVGEHVISHDEVYYVLSGTGVVISDGVEAELGEGMAAYLFDGANVGIRQTGKDPLVIIIAYPLDGRKEP